MGGPILGSQSGSGRTRTGIAESGEGEREFSAATAAIGSVALAPPTESDNYKTLRTINLTASSAGDGGNDLVLKAESNVGYPDAALASVDGFAASAQFEYGGRNFTLKADDKGEADNALRAIFKQESLRGGAPFVEASMDGFAAAIHSGVRSGTTFTVVHNTKGAAQNGFQIRVRPAVGNNAAPRSTLHNIPGGSYLEVTVGRNRNVNWNQIVQQINRTNSGNGTQLVTASITGNEAGTNFNIGTTGNFTFTLRDGEDAVDADTLVVRIAEGSAPSVTEVLTAINGVTGKRMTASSSETGTDELLNTSEGTPVTASATATLPGNKTLGITARQSGEAGNGIRLEFVYDSATNDGTFAIAVQGRVIRINVRGNLNGNDLASAIDASSAARALIRISRNYGGSASFRSSSDNVSLTTAGGGTEGQRTGLYATINPQLRFGEDAIPNTTVLRSRGASMTAIVAAINAITSGKTMTAALASGADGGSFASFKDIDEPRQIYLLSLSGGRNAGNTETVLSTELDGAIDLEIEGSKALMLVAVDWKANVGNVDIKVQRRFGNEWKDILARTQVLGQAANANLRFAAQASGVVERLFEFGFDVPGTYRIVSQASAAGTRANLKVELEAI